MEKLVKRTLSRKAIIVLSAQILGGAWLVVTVVYPLVLGSGINNYAGPKRVIAERILKLQRLTFTSSPAPDFVQQVHIDDVRPVSQTEITKYCKDNRYITDDPNNLRYYSVVTTERHLFGIGSYTTTYIGCEPRGFQREEFGLPDSVLKESQSATGSNAIIIKH